MLDSPKACNFIKKRFQHKYFPVDIAKCFRTPCFTEHLRLLLLASDKEESSNKLFITLALLTEKWHTVKNSRMGSCNVLPHGL